MTATFDVLRNDTDLNGDRITINSVTQPDNGIVSVNPDNSLTYTPNSNFTGNDSFTYEISDGNGGIDTATVNLTVVAGEDPTTIEFNPVLNLSDLNGRNGFVIKGIDERDFSGSSVSGAGDVNGDGFDDLIIGAGSAEYGDNFYGGQSYVVFGSDQGFNENLNLSELDGNNGFTINGGVRDFSGYSVSEAGDINGDGIDDLIIGAPWKNYSNYDRPASNSYVIFGSNQGFSANLNLSELDGSNGFVISVDNGGNRNFTSDFFSGSSVSKVGDLNGDGFDDLIIGAPKANYDSYPSYGAYNIGKSYVVFGSNQGFSSNLNLFELDQSNGFVLTGIDRDDFSGSSVSGVGDFNGDGFDDLIIGASDADPNDISAAGES